MFAFVVVLVFILFVQIYLKGRIYLQETCLGLALYLRFVDDEKCVECCCSVSGCARIPWHAWYAWRKRTSGELDSLFLSFFSQNHFTFVPWFIMNMLVCFLFYFSTADRFMHCFVYLFLSLFLFFLPPSPSTPSTTNDSKLERLGMFVSIWSATCCKDQYSQTLLGQSGWVCLFQYGQPHAAKTNILRQCSVSLAGYVCFTMVSHMP